MKMFLKCIVVKFIIISRTKILGLYFSIYPFANQKSYFILPPFTFQYIAVTIGLLFCSVHVFGWGGEYSGLWTNYIIINVFGISKYIKC